MLHALDNKDGMIGEDAAEGRRATQTDAGPKKAAPRASQSPDTADAAKAKKTEAVAKTGAKKSKSKKAAPVIDEKRPWRRNTKTLHPGDILEEPRIKTNTYRRRTQWSIDAII